MTIVFSIGDVNDGLIFNVTKSFSFKYEKFFIFFDDETLSGKIKLNYITRILINLRLPTLWQH